MDTWMLSMAGVAVAALAGAVVSYGQRIAKVETTVSIELELIKERLSKVEDHQDG